MLRVDARRETAMPHCAEVQGGHAGKDSVVEIMEGVFATVPEDMRRQLCLAKETAKSEAPFVYMREAVAAGLTGEAEGDLRSVIGTNNVVSFAKVMRQDPAIAPPSQVPGGGPGPASPRPDDIRRRIGLLGRHAGGGRSGHLESHVLRRRQWRRQRLC